MTPEEAEAEALAVRLATAMLFASSEPVAERALTELLLARCPGAGLDGAAALALVRRRFENSGVALVQVAGGWQFRTAPELAPLLETVLERPRRLSRVAMETLAIVAYHQPCSRTDIEAVRGVSLSQQTLDTLLETGLIVPRGRRQVPGRPMLWGTSDAFLVRFGLRSLSELPRREELLLDLPGPASGPAPGLAPGPADG